jgi:hypothetical protein
MSIPIVAILLSTSWSGKSTWFGNYLHGRGHEHYNQGKVGFWPEYIWLVFRNPVSNFGKFVLSVNPEYKWVWLIDQHIVGTFWVKYGWKNPDERLPGSLRSFIFRPWFK